MVVNGTYENPVHHMLITMYEEYDGVTQLGGTYMLDRTYGNGAYDGNSSVTAGSSSQPGSTQAAMNSERMLFVGTGPSNIRVYHTDFNTNLNNGTMKSYSVQLRDEDTVPLTESKIINIHCSNLKNYQPIRLTWLNQWGGWDYYTFNQKSVKSIDTKGTTYQQLGGTRS